MTKQEQETLNQLAMNLFDVAVRFKVAAKENKSRLEVLEISKDYCLNIDGIHTFLKGQEENYINTQNDTNNSQENK